MVARRGTHQGMSEARLDPASATRYGEATRSPHYAPSPSEAGGTQTGRFHPEDYPATIAESGLKKLSASQVAPLVASARGYVTASQADIPAILERVKSDDKKIASARAHQAKTALSSEALIMPWYSANSVGISAEGFAEESFLQMRPATPIPTRDGRTKKYDNFTGQTSVVDIHPATPPEWITDTNIPIIFTEGIIKGDSTLSALLLANGIGEEDLYAPEGQDSFTASRTHLRSLMRTLQRPYLILSAVGVSNHQRESWSNVRLQRREFLLGFDGDMTRNPNVWRETNKLWRLSASRGAHVRLIDLTDDGARKETLGLDDYFGSPRHWPFARVISRTLDEMPELKSEDIQLAKGAVRIAPDGFSMQECIDIGEGELAWATRLSYGARLKAMYVVCSPGSDELSSWKISPETMNASGDELRVEVEVKWRDEATGDVTICLVRGNGALLETPPSQWTKSAKASIPGELAYHPEWPPRLKLGDQFLAAMKQHQRPMVQKAVHWKSLGWCPGEKAPVFLTGSEVIEVDTASDLVIAAEVDEAHQSRFGLPLPSFDLNGPLEETQGRVLDLFTRVYNIFMGEIDGVPEEHQPITYKPYGAILMLAGMRPLVPIRPKSVLYLWGPPQQGKSFWAETVMSGWQAYPGAFSDLPGTADDSLPATEQMLAQMPLWAIDDLAPNQSLTQARQKISKVEQIFRLAYNGQTRNIMSHAADGYEVRRHVSPRALLIGTGEIELRTDSIQQRTTMLNLDGTCFGKRTKTYDPFDPVREMRQVDNAFAKLNRVLLEAFIHEAREVGFSELIAMLNTQRQEMIAHMSSTMGEDSRRASENLADLALSVSMIEIMSNRYRLYEHPGFAEFMRRFSTLKQYAMDTAAITYTTQREEGLGVRFAEALISVLSSGDGYIVLPEAENDPPLRSEQNRVLSNSSLGWKNGATKPNATRIGYLYTKDAATEDDALVLMDTSEAFRVASKLRPDLITPGTTMTSAWQSMWKAKIPLDGKWSRTKGQKQRHFCQVSMPNGSRVSVVPIMLSKILEREPLTEQSE